MKRSSFSSSSPERRLYTALICACVAGYGWVVYNTIHADTTSVKLCYIKRLTGLPCPACGSTRSVLALSNAHFARALYWNPLGFVLAAIMVIAPALIIYDLVAKRRLAYDLYLKTVAMISRPYVAIPASLLLLANWAWNIYKGF